MSRKLSYPGFSVVFVQTFSLHRSREFVLPSEAEALRSVPYAEKLEEKKDAEGKEYFVFTEKADDLSLPVAWVEKDIENQIFVLPQKESARPMQGDVLRFSLRGFDFSVPIIPEKDEALKAVVLHGHCNVEMNLFFGHVVSMTYRFLFDGHAADGHSCAVSPPDPEQAGEPLADVLDAAETDHLIVFLSNWLSAEFWSTENGCDTTDIDYKATLRIQKIWLDENGMRLDAPVSIPELCTRRNFEQVALRYKKYVYRACSRFKEEVPLSERAKQMRRWRGEGADAWSALTVANDLHYAMVDIWENVRHIEKDGSDLFDKDAAQRLTEAQIIDHIREEHKAELIGLLSLYPEEWPYRDPEAFGEVCGENIAIDTDDLVLAGSSLCVVIGTYGRRGEGEDGVNWVEHLKERAHYHVSWPEYLMILQMILAKKYVIGLATDQVVHSTLDAEEKSPDALIGQNAELSLRLTRMVTQLDVVKYAKFPSHKVMHDRTTARLGIEADYERLNKLMASVDNSLHNQADYKSMKSDAFLNNVLIVVSVVSAFQLFFVPEEMPFLSHWGFSTHMAARILVYFVAVISLTALIVVARKAVGALWSWICGRRLFFNRDLKR